VALQQDVPPDGPSGHVSVAVPAPPVHWWGREPRDVAARDLAALWSLPLLRVDELGRLRWGLAVAARELQTPDGWAVEVDLAAGEWSDRTPVTARDVVATAEALAAARPAEWIAFQGAEVLDDQTVRLDFDRPFARWWALLSDVPGVLPAHVLERDGLSAWDDAVPVSGGPFIQSSRQVDVASGWSAHVAGPLGPPRLGTLDVLVVPDVDVALGLLGDAQVDLVLGHVALDPVSRASELGDVAVGLPFGGSGIELVWEPAGLGGSGLRRSAAAVLAPEPFVAAVLRDTGRNPSGPLPGTLPPPVPDGSIDSASARVAVDRTVESLGLLTRLVRRDLARAGLDVTFLRVAPPAHLLSAPEVDGSLLVRRRGPVPSASAALARAGLDPGPGVRADAAGREATSASGSGDPAPGAWQEVAGLLADAGASAPLADVAPVHVWDPARLTGVTPSAWPGLALWDVARWQVP